MFSDTWSSPEKRIVALRWDMSGLRVSQWFIIWGEKKNRTLLANLWIAADKRTDFFTWLRFEFLSGFRGQRLKPWKHINTPQGNKILSNPQHFLLRIISSPLPPSPSFALSLSIIHTQTSFLFMFMSQPSRFIVISVLDTRDLWVSLSL